MYSRSLHEASNTMKKKNNNATNAELVALRKKVSQLSTKTQKKTPFADAAGIVGNHVGGMFNRGALGKNIGRWLGTGIGSIFGSGDYTLNGMQPQYNTLTNGAQIPQFDRSRHSTVISHREYLGDIQGTTAFTIAEYPLNPGVARTFPWLSSVAAQFQEYRIHGMIFEFRPLITDFVTSGQPGVVVMATNYNSEAPAYTTKQQMENSEFAVSVKPTCNLIHGIECAGNQTILPQRYVRVGDLATDQDLTLYDYGKFQFATQGNPIAVIGELWISYSIEFFKPILTPDLASDAVAAHLRGATVSTSNTLGVAAIKTGNLAMTYSTTSATFQTQPGAKYFLTYTLTSTASDVNVTTFNWVVSGGTLLSYFAPGSSTRVASTTSAGSSIFIAELIVQGTGSDITIAPTINNLGSGVLTLDLFILEVSGSIS